MRLVFTLAPDILPPAGSSVEFWVTTDPSNPSPFTAPVLDTTNAALQVDIKNSASSFREPAVPGSGDLAGDSTDSSQWKVVTSGTESRLGLLMGTYSGIPDARYLTA